MGRRWFTAEQILGLLLEADVELSHDRNVGRICRDIGIAEQTYCHWLKEYGGMKTVQIKKLKELEREHGRLKKEVGSLPLTS